MSVAATGDSTHTGSIQGSWVRACGIDDLIVGRGVAVLGPDAVQAALFRIPTSETDREAAWARLHRIEADPGRYPQPVRWLPELARYACGRTGNPILDCELDPGGQGPWFSWAADLEQVRAAWRRAQPVLAQFRNLITWSEAGSSRLTLLATSLMEGIDYDQLEW